MPAYFITSVNQPDLMEELDRAQYLIHLENPLIMLRTRMKNIMGRLKGRPWDSPREEAEYIENADEVKVLCKAGQLSLILEG